MKNKKKNATRKPSTSVTMFRNESPPTTNLPPLVVRRTEVPHIAEEYRIFPESTAAFCATVTVKHTKSAIILDIKGRQDLDKKWYFHDLTKEQQCDFVSELIKATGLRAYCGVIIVEADGTGMFEFTYD